MAGKKQHFIPQHFLRPFVIPGRGDHLWMYRNGQSSPIRVPRGRAAAQEYFYSRPSGAGLPTLDDLVTEYEGKLHKTVNRIRSLEVDEPIDGPEIGSVIAHLMVRSSYVRSTMKEAIIAVSNSLQDYFSDGSKALFDVFPRHAPSDRMCRMILEELDKAGLRNFTSVSEKTIVDLFYVVLREMGPEVVDGALPILGRTMQELRAGAMEMSRHAHVSALKTMMAPQRRVDELSTLAWRIQPASGDGAILPDCTSIAFNGHQWQALLLTDSEELEAVVLALAPDRLAVGTADKELSVDLTQYNCYAAQASFSFFLANKNSARLAEFIEQIGGNVRRSLEAMTSQAVVDALGDTFRGSEDKDQLEERVYAARRPWTTAITEESHQYVVSFEGFGDEEFAKAVANEVRSVVAGFSEILPISSLEGTSVPTLIE